MIGNTAKTDFSKGGPPYYIQKLDFPTCKFITDIVKDKLKVRKLMPTLKDGEA